MPEMIHVTKIINNRLTPFQACKQAVEKLSAIAVPDEWLIFFLVYMSEFYICLISSATLYAAAISSYKYNEMSQLEKYFIKIYIGPAFCHLIRQTNKIINDGTLFSNQRRYAIF